MLTLPEVIILIIGIFASTCTGVIILRRIWRTILRGKNRPDFRLALKRLRLRMLSIIVLKPTFRTRLWISIMHALVAWGFLFFLLVNTGDVLEGIVPGFHFLGRGTLNALYRLGGDLFSVLVLTGMIALVIRRWVIRPDGLTARSDVLLQPTARNGIRRDSAIVAAFIILHVGARFLGEATSIALEGYDPWQPFASIVTYLFSGLSPRALTILVHVFFWSAIGTILLFIPYFLISKHLHIFFAPLNFLFKPERRSIGELTSLDLEDESIEQFGAVRLEDLGWEQIMDAYACIMCFRCQEACPAYVTGKVLSPAAMEINKRYLLNLEGGLLAKGKPSTRTLIDFVIPSEAVWACTACGACVDICPVNNEPMRDILEIRRSLTLMENNFPKQLQQAFRGMERNANPWNIPSRERMKWAKGLSIATIETNPEPELLWWVGCAPATDVRAQKTARAFASILIASQVNFAILGENEQCTGDAARRAGKEDIFYELASANVALLNDIKPRRIVTTCPHCLHTLKNEYPAYGGHYTVIHHTELILEFINQGLIKLKGDQQSTLTFHDPCYLGRHNGIIKAPRQALVKTGHKFIELARHSQKSFCCGAGGAQMWKEEQHGVERVSTNRFREILASGANQLAVGCPFCMIMLNDARKDAGSDLDILDIAEIVAQQLA